MLIRQFLSFILVATLLVPVSTNAKSNILFILDGSNSMWGQIEGEAKILIAQKVLSDLLKDLPGDTKTGLMAYGHRKKNSCKDIEILSGIGESSIDTLIKKINALKPKGKTPIANALEKSKGTFKGLKGQNNHILLVSDGIESCDGDPCAVAKTLQLAGLDVSAHVIGFGVSKEEGKQLTCIAENTGGKYFDAANAVAFNKAIEEVTQIAQAEPEPVKPKPTLWLDDNFDGEELAGHWEIINPNPDNYIVENGELLELTSKVASFKGEDIDNLIRLNKDLPKGDWKATIKMNIEFQTRRERVFFGLYDDKENYVLNELSVEWEPNHHVWMLFVYRTKVLKGKITSSRTHVWSTAKTSSGNIGPSLATGQPILMRFEKKGRSYTSAIKMEGIEDPKWIDLPKLKLLRQKGNIAFGVYQERQASGETTILVDSIKVETMQTPKNTKPDAAK
jgi:Ca-activated chloride channel homolog